MLQYSRTSHDTSKDRFLALDDTLMEAFFEISIIFCLKKKNSKKVKVFKIAPND